MAFDGPETTDYRNVVSLNRAYLTWLQRDLRCRQGLRRLSTRLAEKISNLNKRQIERLAATPFLLLSFREGNDHYWSKVLGNKNGGDLFTSSGSDDLDNLVSAGLGFIWQDPSDNTRQDDYGMETFWRFQLTENIQITPDLQVYFDPSQSVSSDAQAAFGLRVGLYF